MRLLELLSPARTADIGIEAIRHGADAVYIGASQFGARQAAGNSVKDIARLSAYAHQFGARVYATVNTIVYDTELEQVEELLVQLMAIGVDAFIVQDMSLLELRHRSSRLKNMVLHASTQMDNRTATQLAWLQGEGISQVVLARELSLDEIRHLHVSCPDIRLEVFVHGALCVSLSGRCYASQSLFGRSANRGACAQVCRLSFDLEDEQGTKYVRDKHLLSLRDLCQLDALEDLAGAGASSFKIEGRLKDMAYVKNVTAAYSLALDRLCEKYPDRYCRSSHGRVDLHFQPDVNKTFNRGFTHYFLYGRTQDIFSFDTPKSMGLPLGRVESIDADSFVLITSGSLSNGDGLSYFDPSGQLVGLRVNRAEGRRVYPLHMPSDLQVGMFLYRNYDKHFADQLAGCSSDRYLPVDIGISHDQYGFMLTADDGYHHVQVHQTYAPQLARTPQADNIHRQLSRLGNTILRARTITIHYSENYFIPSSLLSQWRRDLVQAFTTKTASPSQTLPCKEGEASDSLSLPLEGVGKVLFWGSLSPLNVANHLAANYYHSQGHDTVPLAYELQSDVATPLMTCRHCLRYAMGWCTKRGGTPLPQRLYLRMRNGHRLSLRFDCDQCLMYVLR